jgi:hypothetical protein
MLDTCRFRLASDEARSLGSLVTVDELDAQPPVSGEPGVPGYLREVRIGPPGLTLAEFL